MVDTVSQMRESFDLSFTTLPSENVEDKSNCILIRCQTQLFLLRAMDLSSLEKGKRVLQVPSSSVALLGLCGKRGQIVPVYSLAVLLGYSPETLDQGNWLAFIGKGETIALSFTGFEGYVAIPKKQIASLHEKLSGPIQGSLQFDSTLVQLIDTPSLLAEITKNGGSTPDQGR